MEKQGSQRESQAHLSLLAGLPESSAAAPIMDNQQFIDNFRRNVCGFAHAMFVEFAASITGFGFPARVEFSSDMVEGIDCLVLRLVPLEQQRWDRFVAHPNECYFALRALHRTQVVEHVMCCRPEDTDAGQQRTACCLHSITAAVLDREMTTFLRTVLEARARTA